MARPACEGASADARARVLAIPHPARLLALAPALAPMPVPRSSVGFGPRIEAVSKPKYRTVSKSNRWN